MLIYFFKNKQEKEHTIFLKKNKQTKQTKITVTRMCNESKFDSNLEINSQSWSLNDVKFINNFFYVRHKLIAAGYSVRYTKNIYFKACK